MYSVSNFGESWCLRGPSAIWLMPLVPFLFRQRQRGERKLTAYAANGRDSMSRIHDALFLRRSYSSRKRGKPVIHVERSLMMKSGQIDMSWWVTDPKARRCGSILGSIKRQALKVTGPVLLRGSFSLVRPRFWAMGRGEARSIRIKHCVMMARV